MQADVVIVGGGPVGVGLAIDLAINSVSCIIVERHDSIQRIPKGQNLTPRTGEHFRRWGVTEAIRGASPIPRSYGSGGSIFLRADSSGGSINETASTRPDWKAAIENQQSQTNRKAAPVNRRHDDQTPEGGDDANGDFQPTQSRCVKARQRRRQRHDRNGDPNDGQYEFGHVKTAFVDDQQHRVIDEYERHQKLHDPDAIGIERGLDRRAARNVEKQNIQGKALKR